jgi:tetratricopeptide (TPR) repeat protein
MELPRFTEDEIECLAEKGNEAVNAQDYAAGVQCFETAFDLLPAPRFQWPAATWLLTAIGETYFFLGDYENARSALLDAMHCPAAIGNPFIHLRLGQVHLELGNEIIAADELARAYMGGGREIFNREDGKYFSFVTSVLVEPPNGW